VYSLKVQWRPPKFIVTEGSFDHNESFEIGLEDVGDVFEISADVSPQ